MSFLAQGILQANSPDTQAHGYIRPDSQIQGEIESKVTDFKKTMPTLPPYAAGLAGLSQRKANILAEDDQASAVEAERRRLYTSSYGPVLGDRLLGGPYTTVG